MDLGSRKDTMAIRRLARFVMTPARKLALRKAQRASAAAARRKGKKVIAGKVKRKAVRAASKRIQRNTPYVVNNLPVKVANLQRVQKQVALAQNAKAVAVVGGLVAIRAARALEVKQKNVTDSEFKRRDASKNSLPTPKPYRPRNVGRSKAAEQEYKRLSAQQRIENLRRTMLNTRYRSI